MSERTTRRRSGTAVLAVLALLALAAPLAAQAFDPEAATEAYLASVPAEARAKADAYVTGGQALFLAGFAFDLVFAAWLLTGRRSARLRDLVARGGGGRARTVALYTAAYWLLRFVLAAPLLVYQYFLREKHYGFSTQSWSSWGLDFGKQLVVTLVGMCLLHVVLYAGLSRLPRTWWLWGWAVSVVFVALAMVVVPVVVAPLFGATDPIAETDIEEPLLDMAREHGVPVEQIYVVRDAEKTERVRAYVVGLFGTQRIVFNDNLLERASLAELRAVLGHEIAHYKAGHIYWLLAWMTLLLLGGFAFVRWGFERVRRTFGRGWGVRAIDDVAGLPLIWALFSLFLFLTQPLHVAALRSIEVSADRAGLEISREPDGFAGIVLELSETRKLEPSKWEEAFFCPHPGGRSRIRMAMEWKAEHLAEAAAP